MATNNNNVRWITALVGFLVVFSGVVFGFVRPRIARDEAEYRSLLADHERRIRSIEECMHEQKVDLKYIKSGITDIRNQLAKDHNDR